MVLYVQMSRSAVVGVDPGESRGGYFWAKHPNNYIWDCGKIAESSEMAVFRLLRASVVACSFRKGDAVGWRELLDGVCWCGRLQGTTE